MSWISEAGAAKMNVPANVGAEIRNVSRNGRRVYFEYRAYLYQSSDVWSTNAWAVWTEGNRYVVKDTLFALEKWLYKPFDDIPSQKGIADLVYIPKADFAKTQPVVVIELKWDKSPANAIKQIEDKDYFSRFKHMGKGFLLVGISNNSKTKQHECSTKLIEQ